MQKYFVSNPSAASAPYAEATAAVAPKVETFLSTQFDAWSETLDRKARGVNITRIFYQETNATQAMVAFRMIENLYLADTVKAVRKNLGTQHLSLEDYLRRDPTGENEFPEDDMILWKTSTTGRPRAKAPTAFQQTLSKTQDDHYNTLLWNFPKFVCSQTKDHIKDYISKTFGHDPELYVLQRPRVIP